MQQKQREKRKKKEKGEEKREGKKGKATYKEVERKMEETHNEGIKKAMQGAIRDGRKGRMMDGRRDLAFFLPSSHCC